MNILKTLKKIVILTISLVFVFISLETNVFAAQHDIKTYQSASEVDFPPFSIVTNGEADGFSVDLLKAVASEMGIKINFKVDHWNVIKQELVNGQLDILPLVGYSKERDEYFDFTIPYIVLRGNIFVRKDDSIIKSENDLYGKEIIVMRSDASQEYAQKMNFTDKLILVDTYAQAFELLSSGKHDAVLAQSLVGEKLINDLKISNVQAVSQLADNGIDRIKVSLSGFEVKFSFAVKEGDKELLALLNEGLAIVSENGTYQMLYEKWFPFLVNTTPDYSRVIRYFFSALSIIIFIILLLAYFYIHKEVERKTFKLKEISNRNAIMFNVMSQEYDSVTDWLDYSLVQIIKLTGSEFGYIYLYQEDTQEIVLHSWSHNHIKECLIDEEMTNFHLDNSGLCGEAIRQRKPIILNEMKHGKQMTNDDPLRYKNLNRMMVIPVFEEHKIVATVGLANKTEFYDENDIYQVTLLMGGVWNMIEKERTRETLEIAKNRYLSTIVSIGDGVMVVGLDEKIEMINKACAEMTGWSESDAKGRHYREVLWLSHENSKQTVIDPIFEVLTSGSMVELHNHTKLTSTDGRFYMIESSASPVNNSKNEMLGVVLVFRDMTLKHNHIKEIEYLSYHDSLTGLYNRRFFEEEFKRLDTQRNYPLTIIMADLNGLKITNDTFGHHAGDELLKATALLFKTHLRADDIAARWGGDEFAILMPKTQGEEAQRVIKRMIQGVDELAKDKGILSIAFGWETKEDKNVSLDELFKNAEEYMYKRKLNESDGIRGVTIKTIMNTLFEKSPREQEHSQRVKDMSVKIAKAMNLSQHLIDDIGTLGMLHDIGKIIISGEILEKKGSLTPEEYEEIKKHPSIGYRILVSTKEFSNLANGVLYHHERWDGKGYPTGLKEENIPIESRIIAIADAFDAMMNSRPYREEGLPYDYAKQEIIQNAGTQFDPNIVKLVIEKEII